MAMSKLCTNDFPVRGIRPFGKIMAMSKLCTCDFPVKHKTSTNTNVFVNNFVNKPLPLVIGGFCSALELKLELNDDAMKSMEKDAGMVFNKGRKTSFDKLSAATAALSSSGGGGAP